MKYRILRGTDQRSMRILLPDGNRNTSHNVPMSPAIGGYSWLLRYGSKEPMTKEMRMDVASILDSFSWLLEGGTVAESVTLLRKLRKVIKESDHANK